jgi:hypothetical protein
MASREIDVMRQMMLGSVTSRLSSQMMGMHGPAKVEQIQEERREMQAYDASRQTEALLTDAYAKQSTKNRSTHDARMQKR